MQNKIKLSQTHKEILIKHAQGEMPNESCAVMFGKNDDSGTVLEVFLTENIEKSPVNFTISNEQLIDVYRTAQEKGLDVVGIFHSHPDSKGYPSDTDKRFMQSNPVVWIIYSGTDMDFRAFVLETEIREISVEFE